MKQFVALPIAMVHRMSFLIFSLLLVASLTTMAAAQSNDVNTQLKDVADKVHAKRAHAPVAWKIPEAELTPELEELDAICSQHKGENPEDLANVLRFKATVYWSVLDNTEKGITVIRQIKKDYPNTAVGRDADRIIDSIQQAEESRKILRTLTNGAQFPDFSEKDIVGNPLSVGQYRDKLVLVEFWATWCAPCVAELPNIIKAYNKHHAEGLEVIGVSLDFAQDEQKLKSFLKTKEIPWAQYFDGKGWKNKLAAKYGIDQVPATFLLDRQGKIIGQDLHGDGLEEALAKALTNTR